MDSMKVKIDDLVFDRASYDADGDVLYLTRGESNMAADAALTPEGHRVVIVLRRVLKRTPSMPCM